MGSGNGQHRSRRHRQGHEKKDGTLVAQQSTQQASKHEQPPTPHSEPRPGATSGGSASAISLPVNGAFPKNAMPPEDPTRALDKPPVLPMKTARHTGQNTPTPRGDLTDMLDALRALFVQDRAISARADAARCGICYLAFTQEEVTYREEDGFYICVSCAQALGSQRLPMLRRQKK